MSSKPYVLVRTFRYCQRCERWRSVGNFTHKISRDGHHHYAARICRRCIPEGQPYAVKLTRRAGWTVTDKGRALLAGERHVA